MSEVFETRCSVWDLDYQTPEDDSFPCATFIIDVQATFTTAASYSGDHNDEEEQDGDEPFFMEPETESVVVEKTLDVGVQNLMDDNSSVRVREMLLSMDIPVQDFMVERILACAHRMGTIERYRNRKVLRMRVEIEAIVDELPHNHDHDLDHDVDENEDEDEDNEHSSNESETAAVIEKLRKVVIESPNQCCPICLEDFLVGTEASGMQNCSHVFHPHCIIPWLHKKKICPLCRTELN